MHKCSYTFHKSVYKAFLQPPNEKWNFISRPTYPFLFKTQSVDEHYSSSGVKGLSFRFLFTTINEFFIEFETKRF